MRDLHIQLTEAAHAVLRSRDEYEGLEQRELAPWAEHSATSRGRVYPSDRHPYRTEFQKDRDRIVHTTAFRRLQYKTQVFVNYEGDYYRTRLTHTGEAAQIARTMAQALRCNDVLAEAITLAHDLGHSPFGHSGEITLDRLMLTRMGRDPDDSGNKGHGFNHTLQSLRIVEKLEKRWPEFDGLNLTWETREGIAKHVTEYDTVHSRWIAPYEPNLLSSLEAQIVNAADELTYSSHDLDDGLRSGVIDLNDPALADVEIWQRAIHGISDADPELRRHRAIRRVIDGLISDLIYSSAVRIADAAPSSPDDVRRAERPMIALSDEMQSMQRQLKDFLYQNVYRQWRVIRMYRKAEFVLTQLFQGFEQDFRQLPAQTRAKVVEAQPAIEPGGALDLKAYRVIVDYLAGMTDRFAIQEHRRMFDPTVRA